MLRQRAVFDDVRRRGRRLNHRAMLLSVLPAGGTSENQVAFLTPKRLGPATVRNQLRRRMREIFRRAPGSAPAGLHLVWMARAPAIEFTFAELRECMIGLVSRLGR